jgi:hypothetical protein
MCAAGSHGLTQKTLMAVCAALLLALAPAARAESEQQTLEELRNTVINLLQALVEQGVMPREKAEALVKRAEEKAAADVAAKRKEDEGAVRVPYVPQIVKDEIGKEVAAEVKDKVTEQVLATAKSEGWGVPGGLPTWVRQIRLLGDVRFRLQSDLYGRDNVPFTILDYNSINAAGGITKAGTNAYLNVTQDRERMRLRARFGAEATVAPGWTAGVRLSTAASPNDPSSESQTLGTGAAHYASGFDLAYIRYEPKDSEGFAPFTLSTGRFTNPWFAPTELIYARDVSFEGLAATGRLPFGLRDGQPSNLFFTLGAFPFQEIPLADNNEKWLIGGQFGIFARLGDTDRVTFAAGYFDFLHLAGVQNPPGLTITNYTAPPFIRFGNTYFDISNTTDPTVNLYALAAQFRLANLAASYAHQFQHYTLSLTADAVRNVGYQAQDVFFRSGILQAARNRGYVGELRFGDADVLAAGRWRAGVGYRYVQRDAVIDAWTDADFHEGGTNALGYFLTGDLGVALNTWLRFRYLSSNEIDGPRYANDVIQLDLNVGF